MKKKKILQINSFINFGSTGRIVEEIGQQSISEGWESYIAFGRNQRSSNSNLIRIGTDWDVKLHGVMTRYFDRHAFSSTNATKKLVEQIQTIEPDIIHLHNLHGYYINIQILFNYFATIDTQIVWTLHDCWAFTGHCAFFDYVGCDKWQISCNNCPQKKSYPKSLFLDNSNNNFQLKKSIYQSIKNLKIVPVSHWLGKLIKKSILSSFPLQVINNGIDIQTFKPIKNNIGDKLEISEKFIILGVANIWEKRKGLNDFLKLNKYLDKNMIIILIGLTNKQINLLPDSVIGIAKTESTQELAQFYSLADVFINPTWEDTFPTTNLEAMACGTPVISYSTGGCVEQITSETGIIVNKGDIEGLLHAINVIKKNGKEKYTDACIERVKLNYNKNKQYLEYIRLYEDLLHRNIDKKKK